MAGDGQVPPDRHHREDEQRREEGQVRRQLEDEPVGAVGDEVLLEEELHPVGQRLEQPVRAGAVGPDPALHVADDLALEQIINMTETMSAPNAARTLMTTINSSTQWAPWANSGR